MNRKRPLVSRFRVVALASAIAFTVVQPAQALFGVGDIVLDPSNLAQNMLTAARTLEQINNQVQQLQNEANMLINQARNLERLDFNSVNRLRSALATTGRLIAEAQGLAYEVNRIDQEFARLYPQEYAASVSGDRMAQDARERWAHTLNGLHTALRMQGQVSQNLSTDEGVLTDLVNQSQSANGALQAMQATNQSIQSQQLRLTQDRAASLELARQAAATERGREVTRRFLGEGTAYTPQAVSFYGY